MTVFSEKDGDIGNFTVEISNEALKEFAYSNFDITDIFPDDDVLRYIKEHYNPEDVFSIEDLTFWAEQNGYIKD